MLNYRVTTCAALLCASLISPAAAQERVIGRTTSQARDSATSSPATTPLLGRWTLARQQDGKLQLELQWSDGTQWRRSLMLDDLDGLTANTLASLGETQAGFRMDREPGRFDFSGRVGRWRGDGEFEFAPRRDAVAAFRSEGVRIDRDVRDHDLKNLAFGDMSARSVREFRELGLDVRSLDDLVELAIRQVRPDYVRSLQAAGYRDLTTHQVADLKHRGVRVERR